MTREYAGGAGRGGIRCLFPCPFQAGVESATSMLSIGKCDRAGWSLRSPARGPGKGISESGFTGERVSLRL